MPAIVKASAAMSSGQIVLIEQTFGVSGSNDLTLNARYACLAANSQTWAARLLIGVEPPVAAPTAILSYNLQSPLALTEVTQNTTAGITYFDCKFSAPRVISHLDADNQIEITETSSIELRQFQGSAFQTYRYKGKTYSTGTKSSYQFDYYAESKTLTASHNDIYDLGETVLVTGRLYISGAFNLQIPSSWSNRFSWKTTHAKFVQYSRTKTKSSTGSYRYSITGAIRYRYNGEFNSSPLIS